ncbi:MAG TPA: hypothetical protein VND87_19770 [Stellaceae bacterium]|nr:hypothetical protein [Stellaceae bacterium]
MLFAAGAAHADGLSKFNELIKAKMPPGALTYKSAKAVGDYGFALEDVVVTPPPDSTGGAKAQPIKIHAVTVENIDFDSIAKKAPPNFVKMRIEGIDVDKNPATGIDLKAFTGIDKATADVDLDYRIDPAKKTMTLNHLTFTLDGLGRLELSMILDGVTVSDVDKPDKAMNDATLRTASLVYDDHSLLGTALPAAAKAGGMDPAAVITMAKAFLDGLRKGQGEAAGKVFDAIESFLEDYKSPKGPLRLTFNPPPKTSVETITGAKGADEVIKALGLTVNYAGTRKQAAAAAPK